MMKNECVSCFKNLSVGTRYKIYNYIKISGKQLNESEITDYVKLKQPTVSYHLKGMVKSGLLQSKSVDKYTYFGINANCPHDGHKCFLV